MGDRRVVKKTEEDSVNNVCEQIKLELVKIIQEATEQINRGDIEFLIWHGRREGKDVDLLAVLKKEQGPRVRLYKSSRNLDILTIGEDEFVKRLLLYDPLVTEPVMTGIFLLGDKTTFGELRNRIILNMPPSNAAIQFLKQQADERLKMARILLQDNNKGKDGDDLLCALTELSLAGSYYAFAGYYGNGPKFFPITLSHLLAIDGLVVLREIMKSLRMLKLGKDFKRTQIVDLFGKTQKLLIPEAIF